MDIMQTRKQREEKQKEEMKAWLGKSRQISFEF